MSALLDDVLVLDLTRALAGPNAAMMLGDLGAPVIKVKSPTDDDTRSWGPPFVHPDHADGERESTYFCPRTATRNPSPSTSSKRPIRSCWPSWSSEPTC